jgi:diaminopimelate epimerase
MMRARFHKYHALGNDYIVLDPATFTYALDAHIVRLICDRHRGIGADGILYGPLRDGVGPNPVRIFNPDGSEAEKSGNGLRIFARYLRDAGYAPGDSVTITTTGGPVRARFEDMAATLVSVAMGRLSFDSAAIPVAGPPREVVEEEVTIAGQPYRITAATIGNPHCVIFATGDLAARAQQEGPAIERAGLFPKRTNVQFARVIDQHTLQIAIWERGAGYTLASGSSSCAAAGAAIRTGRCTSPVEIRMPGGSVIVTIAPDWSVRLTGAVAAICEGALAGDLIAAIAR